MKPEQQLAHQVMTWLALKNILHYRTRNTGTIVHRPGGITFGRDRYWRTQQGCPDILAWRNGKAYAFELKSEKGRLTLEQRTWLARFNQEGGVGIVARSLEDVMGVLGQSNG